MFTYASGNPNGLCRKREREALITFKQGIINPSKLLSSWIGEECCMWRGIGCDNIIGRFIQLSLENPYNETTSFEAFEQPPLDGIISDSLLELKHLHYLDLSENNFKDHIRSFFGDLRNLRYFVKCGFRGYNSSSAGKSLELAFS